MPVVEKCNTFFLNAACLAGIALSAKPLVEAINTTVYNPIMGNALALGTKNILAYKLIRSGVGRIKGAVKADRETMTRWKKVSNIAYGTAMILLAANTFPGSVGNIQNIFSSYPSDNNEALMVEMTGKESLEFDKLDPREKVLFLSAEFDHNGAMNPSFVKATFLKYVLGTGLKIPLSELNEFYDLKYRTFSSLSQMCQLISNTSMPIDSLWIKAHGEPFSMRFSDSETFNYFSSIPKNCFSNLSEAAKLFLISCNAGAKRFGIADFLAHKANRVVVACNNLMYSELIKVSQAANGLVSVDYPNLGGASSCLRVFAPNLATTALYYSVYGLGVISAAKATGKIMKLASRIMDASIDLGSSRVKKISQKLNFYTEQRADNAYNFSKFIINKIYETGKLIDKSASFCYKNTYGLVPRLMYMGFIRYRYGSLEEQREKFRQQWGFNRE